MEETFLAFCLFEIYQNSKCFEFSMRENPWGLRSFKYEYGKKWWGKAVSHPDDIWCFHQMMKCKWARRARGQQCAKYKYPTPRLPGAGGGWSHQSCSAPVKEAQWGIKPPVAGSIVRYLSSTWDFTCWITATSGFAHLLRLKSWVDQSSLAFQHRAKLSRCLSRSSVQKKSA